MPYQHIIYEKEEPFAILTFNRPEVRNALNSVTMDEAIDAVKNAEQDDSVRVLIITV